MRKYNEIKATSTADPIEGEMIYIERKQTKWFGEEQYHRVKPGETLLSISQEYGIQLNKLASLNHLKPTALLQIGQQIMLRK